MEFEWRSYLLRPNRRKQSDGDEALEKFRAYTRSWMKPASDSDAGDFRAWHSDEGPPSHSVPAHLVSKAAARLGPEAFQLIHERLMRAYFSESRDISCPATLLELWEEVGLPREAFEVASEPGLVDEVMAEHNEAVECGATGVPAVRLADNPAVIVGAHPIDLYRTWIERSLARREAASSGEGEGESESESEGESESKSAGAREGSD